MAVARQAHSIERARAAAHGHPFKVGVLVDLILTPDAGGHVKCWQRFAEAAVECPELDLTVHFNGPEADRIELAPNVRYVLLPPVFSTARIIRQVPDHTDLAPWHPRLARMLAGYDVIHTTDAFFCYARTATRVGRRHGIPVVSSIHTNTPEYARLTVANILERTFGRGMAYRAANDMLALPGLASAMLERRLTRHLEQVTLALGNYAGVSDPRYEGRDSGISLRRGLDWALFNPAKRDRARFEARFGLPSGELIAMYAGKLNVGKNVPLLIPVIEKARRGGAAVHLFCAGAGAELSALETALGPTVTCAGPLDQRELACAYASADLFLFPSVIDESGNAAVEALASGLPALLAVGSGVAARMADCAGVRVLPGKDPDAWAAAIFELVAEPERLNAMRVAARAYVEARVPSWREVLVEDLLPVWRAAATTRAAA